MNTAAMNTAVLVVQYAMVGLLLWGAFLCLARRDRRAFASDRRASARGPNSGRRQGDLVLAAVGERARVANPGSAAPQRRAA
jgi:hypothetical protein